MFMLTGIGFDGIHTFSRRIGKMKAKVNWILQAEPKVAKPPIWGSYTKTRLTHCIKRESLGHAEYCKQEDCCYKHGDKHNGNY